jgi:hypothetical protein
MLTACARLQSGTTTKSERVVRVDPKFALRRVADATDSTDNGKKHEEDVNTIINIIIYDPSQKETFLMRMVMSDTRLPGDSSFLAMGSSMYILDLGRLL